MPRRGTKWIRGMLLLLLAAGGSLAQQKQATLAGTVKDAATGETLIGATVRVKQLPATGTVTNEYGFYSLSLPPGSYTLIYSLVGFSEKAFEISLDKDEKLDIALSDQATTLNEVVITADKNDKVSSTQMGAGLVRNMPKMRAMEVSVCSPPERSERTCSFLPGGCA